MKENKFKLTFIDGTFGIYGLKESREEIRNMYGKGKWFYVGDRQTGDYSIKAVAKQIENIEFVV